MCTLTGATVNAMKQASAFPPNFVHSLDATHMMLTALECDVSSTFVLVGKVNFFSDCHPSVVVLPSHRSTTLTGPMPRPLMRCPRSFVRASFICTRRTSCKTSMKRYAL